MRSHLVFSLSALAAQILLGIANPLVAHWGNMRIKHDWGVVPADWECLGLPSVGTTIDLRIALRPHRENALIDALHEVSDIRHKKYGAYLSREQVAELVAPHPDTLELVNSWLKHHGVSSSSISRTHGGSWLTVSGVPVPQANELIGAAYRLYRHTKTNDTILRTVRYALPAALHTHVQTISPTTHFASMRTPHQTPHKLSDEPPASGEPMNVPSRREKVTRRVARRVTIPFLRWLYQTEEYVPAPMGNAIGVVGYLGQYPSPSDLALFMNNFRADAADAGFIFEYVNGGGFDPHDPGIQANIDLQYSQGMAFPARQIFYSTGGEPPFIPDANTPMNTNEPYLDWLNFVLAEETIPRTIITSYSNDEQTVPKDYATSVCELFARLGARGVSVIFPSGNCGVSGTGYDCTANDGSGRVEFLPVFPASCPWITSVGGTTNYYPEVAASLSGGGFSNYFPRPPYQNGEVLTYLQHLGSKYAGLYNDTGRGYPDMSLQALNYAVAFKGRLYNSNSTAFASSTTAGLISLLNDYLTRNGRPPLGFLNPWMYGYGYPGFNDIKSGSNPGCGTEGFSAIPGWDPITGLGTPDFDSLVEILNIRYNMYRTTSSQVSTSVPPTSYVGARATGIGSL